MCVGMCEASRGQCGNAICLEGRSEWDLGKIVRNQHDPPPFAGPWGKYGPGGVVAGDPAYLRMLDGIGQVSLIGAFWARDDWWNVGSCWDWMHRVRQASRIVIGRAGDGIGDKNCIAFCFLLLLPPFSYLLTYSSIRYVKSHRLQDVTHL